jgi:hypothetical protein
MNNRSLCPLLALALVAIPLRAAAATPEIPDWALPGSATHKQVPPPADYHRPSRTIEGPIGVFDAQTDIGGAVVAGDASFDPASGRYTIHSAGYNIWYTRDEFRYLWRKLSGDVSLAATISYPVPGGYGDRKAVLVIRQSLEDSSKEIMAALHGAGLIHLAQRPENGANIMENYRVPNTVSEGVRIGIEKRGDAFTLLVSTKGEPMHPIGAPVTLHFDAPFYVGIGFCSHQPDKMDTAVLSDVTFENVAGKAR